MSPTDRSGLPWVDRSRRTALAALLATNLVPLVGVLALGWSVGALLLVYWLESAVVGLFNVSKIRYAHGAETQATRERAMRLKSNGSTVRLPPAPETIPETPTPRPENGPVVRFFLTHYGLFWAVHGLFVFVLPGVSGSIRSLGTLELATLALGVGATVVSHYVSYRQNYLEDGEWRTVSPGGRLYAPYNRVLVMHLTVVLGAFVVTSVGEPVGALVVMVVVKTALDVRGHLREHGREKPREAGTGAAST